MAENESMSPEAQPEQVHKVLIVEDSDPCAATVEMALLGISGLWLVRAPSGLEALRILKQPGSGVRAIITDLNMPQMDGFELIRQIREEDQISGIPIIVLSADTDPATPGRVAEMKVDAFFAKPFSPAEVRRKLEQLLHATTD